MTQNNQELKTMQERFNERFPQDTTCGYFSSSYDVKNFIQSEIDMAVKEERERIIEMIEKCQRYELGGYEEEGRYMEEDSDGDFFRREDVLKIIDK